MKIVLTSFGAFGNYIANPTQEYAREIFDRQREFFTNEEIYTESMSVDYDYCDKKIPELWTEHKPELVIHLGVHSTVDVIHVEKQSFGTGYCLRDINGCVPNGNKVTNDINVDEEICPIKTTQFDCDVIVRNVNEQNETKCIIKTSSDPGRYLCAYSFFTSLQIDSAKCIFIHVPEPTTKVSKNDIVHLLVLIIRQLILQTK